MPTALSPGAVPVDTDKPIIRDVPGSVGRLGEFIRDWFWYPGESTVAMRDILAYEGRSSRAQLVIYGRALGIGEPTYAVSAELTPDEARDIGFSLLGWAADASDAAGDHHELGGEA